MSIGRQHGLLLASVSSGHHVGFAGGLDLCLTMLCILSGLCYLAQYRVSCIESLASCALYGTPKHETTSSSLTEQGCRHTQHRHFPVLVTARP